MNKPGEAVANTGLLVAAIRASESTREDGLFTDPYAEKLAGDTGRRLLEGAIAATGERSTVQIVVRTRFFDDALMRTVKPQVCIIAAGMDSRAYRLPWPAGTTVFELDQPAVMATKAELLADDTPRARRVAVGVDLAAGDWPAALTAAGFDPQTPTAWLIEGLLQYLDEPAVLMLFERVNTLSANGSVLLYDVVGKTLLDSPMMAGLVQSMAEQGSPWLFGTDEPGALAGNHGWSPTVTDIAVAGNQWGRWYAPAVPMDVPDVPRGYFVEATRP
jgi:methyltransferase (TIGR00027 family)